MVQGLITLTTELTEGGCNACGPVRSELYTLNLGGAEIVLTGFNLSALVLGIVQRSGWQVAFQADILEEYFLFTKESRVVKLAEDFNQVTYSCEGETFESANQLADQSELFEKVNHVLSTFFEIETIDFQVES